MLVNLELVAKNNINLMFLYTRLRWEGRGRSGKFNKKKLTKNEKYKLLPKLVRLGLVLNDQVISHRKVIVKKGLSLNFIPITEDDLKSLDSFKGRLLASMENYLLKSRYRMQNRKVFDPRNKVMTAYGCSDTNFIVKKSYSFFKGRVANSILSEYLGIDQRTISRWRKNSPNKYTYSWNKVTKDIYDPKSQYIKGADHNFRRDLVISTNGSKLVSLHKFSIHPY